MNERPEQPRLLDDVLAEASPSDFRAALLGETLRLARRRRRRRPARQAAGVLVVFLLAAWFARDHWAEKIIAVRPPVTAPVAQAYQLVETRPLSPDALVATREFAPVTMISSQASVVQIATSGGGFRLINDAELLALARPEPALLIRTGPDSEELILAGVAASTKSPPAN